MLYGEGIALRAWKDVDIPLLHELRNHVALQRQLMAQPKPNSMAAVREWLARKSAGVFFVIADSQDAALGFVQAEVNDAHRRAHFGICLHENARGRGIGAAALRLLERYLVNTFSVRKIILEVLADNAQAIRMYRKLGYADVGVHRAHFYAEGTFHDVLVMEKLLASRA